MSSLQQQTESQISVVVLDYIRENVGASVTSGLSGESRIEEDLGMDSLEGIEMMMKIEERYDIELPDQIEKTGVTVNDVVRSIYDTLREKRRG